MTKILVVDDSQFMRTVIANALVDAGYDVETATDGTEAVEAAISGDPDVVTMDVEMPGMSGIDAVERIMRVNPTAVVMLSAYTERGADATLDALERGAIDFIHKPDGSGSRNIAHLVDSVVDAVEDLADSNVSSLALARAAASAHSTSSSGAGYRSRPPDSGVASGSDGDPSLRTRSNAPSSAPATAGPTAGSAVMTSQTATASGAIQPSISPIGEDERYRDDPTIVVGASTGGPKIIEHLLDRLPIELGAKVLVVQHMPVDFTDRFAKRLNRTSSYHVREACDGDRVAGGEVVVARGGTHLRVTNNVGGWVRVCHDDSERRHGIRPAIDVTMQSAADHVTDPLVGVLLTGMGKDGSAGVESISRAGGRTIAQDESTSPVFGIPRHAIETGYVDEVVSVQDLVGRICAAFRTDSEAEADGAPGATTGDVGSGHADGDKDGETNG